MAKPRKAMSRPSRVKGDQKGGVKRNFLKDLGSRAWSVCINPSGFFSGLGEDSPRPALAWIAYGLLVMVVVGGLLSLALSSVVGIPLSQSLSFLEGTDATWLGYLIFLALWYVKLYLASMVEVGGYHLFAWMLGGRGGMRATLQVLAYGSTPVFIAFALPQVLAKDFSLLSPVIQVLTSSYNYSVDFFQVASMVWSGLLLVVGGKELHGFSVWKSVVFAVLPVIVAGLVIVGAGFLWALLIG